MFEFGEALRQGLSREELLLVHSVVLQATSAYPGFGKIQVLLVLFP